MNDLISRQAAIDIFDDYNVSVENGYLEAYSRDRKRLCELPSAQPAIIRCKECIYGEQDDDGWWYCRNFGCQVGNEDGSGFCADAERREE